MHPGFLISSPANCEMSWMHLHLHLHLRLLGAYHGAIQLSGYRSRHPTANCGWRPRP